MLKTVELLGVRMNDNYVREIMGQVIQLEDRPGMSTLEIMTADLLLACQEHASWMGMVSSERSGSSGGYRPAGGRGAECARPEKGTPGESGFCGSAWVTRSSGENGSMLLRRPAPGRQTAPRLF